MHFTKENLPRIRADVDKALTSVEKMYGVKFNLGRITFTGNQFRTKLECNVGESVEDAKGNSWNVNCRKLGLAPSDFGRDIMTRHGLITLSAYLHGALFQFRHCHLCIPELVAAREFYRPPDAGHHRRGEKYCVWSNLPQEG